MDQHHIDETRLVTRRSARDQILLAWNYRCAYCAADLGRSPTLDHVIPKAHGGLTVRSNLAPACLPCNRRKGHREVFSWWREQPHWSELGQARLIDWLTEREPRPCG